MIDARSVAHVGQEALEAAPSAFSETPRRRHIDSSAAVVWKRAISRIGASLDDTGPRRPLRRWPAAAVCAVLRLVLSDPVLERATARCRVPASQMAAIGDDRVPARAAAQPFAPRFRFPELDHGQAPKDAPCHLRCLHGYAASRCARRLSRAPSASSLVAKPVATGCLVPLSTMRHWCFGPPQPTVSRPLSVVVVRASSGPI